MPNTVLHKYLLHLAYDGHSFRGWQRQSNVQSVQQVLEEALTKVIGCKTTVHGCGRTDAMVHASQYFAQFKMEAVAHNRFVYVLNKVLPASIRVYDLIKPKATFNTLHHATKRVYTYYFHTYQNPFIGNFSSYYELKDFSQVLMQEALAMLVYYIDYHSFCKTPDKHLHTIVHIEYAKIEKSEKQDIYRIEIAANRFLKGMVRALVYDVLEIGKGKLEMSDFRKKLEQPAFFPNIQLAYPQGLYLSNIKYDGLKVQAHKEPISYLF